MCVCVCVCVLGGGGGGGGIAQCSISMYVCGIVYVCMYEGADSENS